jgi:hypothetical protein
MTLAVEPMVVAGKRDVKALKDNWTMVTVDNKPACHFEHTVAVTDVGVDVLTDGRQPFTSVTRVVAAAGRTCSGQRVVDTSTARPGSVRDSQGGESSSHPCRKPPQVA